MPPPPTVADALAQAMALAQAGQLDPAAALVARVLAAAPEDPDALQLQGMIARRRGDNEAAVAWLRRSLAARAGQPHVHNNLGNALLALERRAEAIGAYREAVRLDPDYGDALTNLGLALLGSEGEAKAASEALREAVRVGPANAKAWAGLGRALRADARLDEALAAFRESLRLRPGDAATLHNYAVALRLAGEAEEAAAVLQACAEARPQIADIHYNLGHCHQDLGRLDAAVAAYRRAIARAPGHRAAHDSLSRLLWQRGSGEEHLASYAEALVGTPDDAGLLADLGAKLNLEGRTSDTIGLLGGAIARGLDEAAIHHCIAQALWAEGRQEEGLAAFEAATLGAPGERAYRLDLARALIILERYGDALAALEPVLERSPFDQQALAYQGLAWRFLGDPREPALNDHDRLIDARILTPPDGESVAAFNARLEAVLAGLHRARRHPIDQTLRGGTQTMGDLFTERAPEILAVRTMIEQGVRDYLAALPDDDAHPFLGRNRERFRFSGSWSVRLREQGFHLNHVHAAGWISSCYYVGLPTGIGGEHDREGWLKFGETGLALGERERIMKMVRPEVGKLVLFPSYFYHGTVPFTGGGYRTTIAFDVVPD